MNLFSFTTTHSTIATVPSSKTPDVWLSHYFKLSKARIQVMDTFSLRFLPSCVAFFLVVLLFFGSCNEEEPCPEGGLIYIGGDSSLLELQYAVKRRMSNKFELTHLNSSKPAEFIYLDTEFERWGEDGQLPITVDDCTTGIMSWVNVVWSSMNSDMYNVFRVYANEPHLEDLPELQLDCLYEGTHYVGHFRLDEPPETTWITSYDNPDLSVRFQQDSGVVQIRQKGIFKLSQHAR